MRTALVLLLLAAAARAGWEEDLDRLVAAPAGPERDALLESVAEASPGWAEVAARLRATTFPDRPRGGVFLRKTTCRDGVERPWALAVPEGCDPARPAPLLVVLHGGVSRPEVSPDPLEWARENEFVKLALDRGWLAIHPFGQQGATWWDEVGMANVRVLVRTVKRERNVDDDRVFMAGISDGASAGFLHAMVDPNDYGAFVALIGHMGVGSLSGELDTYAPNLANTPIYATTHFDDALYPSRRMRRTVDMALRAGARILYRERQGRHSGSDALEWFPAIADWLERHPRDPLPVRVVWETSSKRFGLCRWLAIDRVTDGEAADWHEDVNTVLTSDRVAIGFQLGTQEGEGVPVGEIVEGSFAESVGMEPGDFLLRVNGEETPDLDALNAAKAKLSRGDAVTVVVRRGGEERELSGNLPEPERYLLFQRSRPSAMARAVFSANRFEVRASRVGRLRILVHPDLVNLSEPVTVRVNGETAFEGRVEPDVAYLLRHFVENRDRKFLPVAEIAIGR